MIKLFNTMIQSKDKNPSHDKHVANLLGDLHTYLTSSLISLPSFNNNKTITLMLLI